MCRLILASGQFSANDILKAAEAMSCGRTADHDGPTDVHPNGWGALWRDPDAPQGIALHRDVRPLTDSHHESPVAELDTDFLAVHARHATLPKNHGLQFTHPLTREAETTWHFMHNGFLPTVHQKLGLPESEFDSREYFDYIIPEGSRRLDEQQTLERLRAIPAGGSSGNAIAVNSDVAYVIHWTSPGVASPVYFGMFRLRTDRYTVIASERIPDLAPLDQWEPLAPDSLIEIPLNGSTSSTSSTARQGEALHVQH
ncbi:class II glutamine amidotransferase [Streptomyces sp. UNOC14_S4]|uniref:class II glutamine amidotransferase n=1 Tax=Streptomyces sp. UNOC14_S4 TaxID=2872340 RepID=UPI001E34ED44|nr:class II glutamine amidotransferase [Streptomyces sp. UNOC14_S4]MCC3766440.1 class II glutamine amidotransferase [Streptomyces sp. UNOC14_S4]